MRKYQIANSLENEVKVGDIVVEPNSSTTLLLDLATLKELEEKGAEISHNLVIFSDNNTDESKDTDALEDKSLDELKEIAKELGIKKGGTSKKHYIEEIKKIKGE